MSFDTDYYNQLELGILTVALIGALNWGLEAADYNLIDVIGLEDQSGIIYAVIGVAGLIVVADLFFDQRLLGEDD